MSLYVDNIFTSEDINANILEHYGIKQSEITEVKLTNCPRCNITLPPSSRFCPQCSLALDTKAAKEIDDKSKLIPEVFAAMQKNPEFQKLFAEVIAKVGKT